MNKCVACDKSIKENRTVWIRRKPTKEYPEWNQPQCISCYLLENPDRQPVLLQIEEE